MGFVATPLESVSACATLSDTNRDLPEVVFTVVSNVLRNV